MGRNCSVCSHRESHSITQDILNGVKYRVIRQRYGIKMPAITYHLQNHIAGPLQRLAEAERRLSEDAALIEPALRQIHRLNEHARKILAVAEATKDYATWAKVARELRKGIELIAKLTGELSQPAADAKPQEIRIIQVPAPLPEWMKPKAVLEAQALPAPEDKPN
jgi:hypothetical protein